MISDLRQALRALGKSPGFTVAAIVTLALGIGATTAVFSLVEATLLRGLPYQDPGRLVRVWETTATGGESSLREASWPDFEALRGGVRAFSRIAGFTQATATLTHGGSPERIPAAAVTADFFSTLGVGLEGRGFSARDEVSGSERVAIVSRRLATRLFGDARPNTSRVLSIDNVPFSIVGVLPPSFHFAPVGDADVWLPLRPTAERRERGYWHWMGVVARLAPGATPAAVKAELDTIARVRAAEDPRAHGEARFTFPFLRDEIVGPVRPILAALGGGVACVLLIACVNVANLILGRSARRRREIAIRLSLGAGRGRLLRFLLAESAVLAAAGAASGLFLARFALTALVALVPEDRRAAMPFLADIRFNGTVLLFTAAVALLSIAVFGLGPALRSALDPSPDVLRAGPGSIPAGRGGRSGSRLVAAEIALALVLLSSAALLARSTVRILRTDPVARPDRLLTLQVWLPPRLRDAAAIVPFEKRLLAEIAGVAGVRGVATVSKLPVGGGETGNPAGPDGRELPEANLRTISAGYLAAIGIPLVHGRSFGDADAPGAPRVVLVNRAFANRAFGGKDPTGRAITFQFMDGKPSLTIVGMTADENVVGPSAAATAVVYFPSSQDPSPSFALVVRTDVDAEGVAGAVRERIARLARDVTTSRSFSLDRLLNDSPAVFLRRFPARLIGAFGMIGLLLSGVGVFGVAARDVARRRREIGIRMALGASPGKVARAILRDTARPLATGIVLGGAASAGAAWIARRLLYDASAGDLPVLAAVAALLAAVALFASGVPALRAARVDPSIALRSE